MIPRTGRNLLLALLVMGAVLSLAPGAGAQEKRSGGVSATLRVDFGSALHWGVIQGTTVEELPTSERPGHDVFRYGGSYYAYSNDRWYMSPRERGDFEAIDDQAVPEEFSNIPRAHWQRYPTRWHEGDGGRGVDRGYDRGYDRGNDRGYSDAAPATMQVRIDYSSRWYAIRGTRVQQLRGPQRPDYDLFRYGGDYYVFDNDNWYTSRRGSGQYMLINERRVPAEMSWVPRSAWQHYPDRWLDDRGRPRNDRGRSYSGNRRY